MKDPEERLLSVEDLTTVLQTDSGSIKAVDRVSFSIGKGEILGLVGESGCGKTMTALSIMRLLPPNTGRIVSGSIVFEGRDLVKLEEKEMRRIRGNRMAMVFQEPLSSLNPVFTCGEQVREAIALHKKLGKKASKELAVEMLRMVKIPEPQKNYNCYPHELSGGMRQRVLIAMAISCQPALVIADEPTSALDVSVQGQIIELMKELQERLKMAVLLITHDLAVVAQLASRVVVMYAGAVLEEAPIRELFHDPLHPYTEGLINSIFRRQLRSKRLRTIPGSVPELHRLPRGCRFSDRCEKVFSRCLESEPPLFAGSSSRRVRCWLRSDSSAEECHA